MGCSEQADGDGSSGEVIDKLEYEVAKYLRSKLPQKQTSFLGHKVDYFIGTFNCFFFDTLT